MCGHSLDVRMDTNKLHSSCWKLVDTTNALRTIHYKMSNVVILSGIMRMKKLTKMHRVQLLAVSKSDQNTTFPWHFVCVQCITAWHFVCVHQFRKKTHLLTYGHASHWNTSWNLNSETQVTNWLPHFFWKDSISSYFIWIVSKITRSFVAQEMVQRFARILRHLLYGIHYVVKDKST